MRTVREISYRCLFFSDLGIRLPYVCRDLGVSRVRRACYIYAAESRNFGESPEIENASSYPNSRPPRGREVGRGPVGKPGRPVEVGGLGKLGKSGNRETQSRSTPPPSGEINARRADAPFPFRGLNPLGFAQTPTSPSQLRRVARFGKSKLRAKRNY